MQAVINRLATATSILRDNILSDLIVSSFLFLRVEISTATGQRELSSHRVVHKVEKKKRPVCGWAHGSKALLFLRLRWAANLFPLLSFDNQRTAHEFVKVQVPGVEQSDGALRHLPEKLLLSFPGHPSVAHWG